MLPSARYALACLLLDLVLLRCRGLVAISPDREQPPTVPTPGWSRRLVLPEHRACPPGGAAAESCDQAPVTTRPDCTSGIRCP
jgi:hypothetical protein